jgi:hypothetical protein
MIVCIEYTYESAQHKTLRYAFMTTLSKLIKDLADKHQTSERPLRYFDVPKRGELTTSEVAYVKKRFKDIVEREACVRADPDDPKCYAKTETDLSPKMKKRKSSYLLDYESLFRDVSLTNEQFFEKHKTEMRRLMKSAPKGLVRIAIETGLPIEALKQVYDIGVGAYATSGSRTGMSAEQWGYGRVYAFIMCYFANSDGRYDTQRFFKNKTDFHIFEQIVQKMV